MARRAPPQLELDRIAAVPDGLPVRAAGPWARDKLAIISAYSRRFTTACKSARGGTYADAFCGPGINRVDGTDEYLWGSAMLATRCEPAFDRLLLMDLSADNIRALRARVGTDPRVRLHQGDANRDFVPMLAPILDRPGPVFCVLDPQGIELRWNTVAALGRVRTHATRPELLILLSDRMGFMRLLPTAGEPSERTDYDMTVFFGNGEWRDIHVSKQRGEITPTEARERYATLYEDGLRSLGYRSVLRCDVQRRGDSGGALYQLIFATEHEAGERIMSDIFDHMTPQNAQMFLF